MTSFWWYALIQRKRKGFMWCLLDRLFSDLSFAIGKYRNVIGLDVSTACASHLQRAVFASANVQVALSKYSAALSQQGQDPDNARQKAEKLASVLYRRMAADPGVAMIRVLGWALRKVFRLMFRRVGVVVDDASLERVKQVAASRPGVPVVLVPAHRSHVDYLLLSFVLFQNDLSVPFIAAGDNLAVPPFGWIFRRCGAFFVRRSGARPSSSSVARQEHALYLALLNAYVAVLLSAGATIEFFIEGGRSRNGKMCAPKVGLLTALYDWVATPNCPAPAAAVSPTTPRMLAACGAGNTSAVPLVLMQHRKATVKRSLLSSGDGIALARVFSDVDFDLNSASRSDLTTASTNPASANAPPVAPRDVLLVPASISYERTIEGSSYVRERLGHAKQRESMASLLRWCLAHLRPRFPSPHHNPALSLAWGGAHVRFGEPISVQAFVEQQAARASAPHLCRPSTTHHSYRACACCDCSSSSPHSNERKQLVRRLADRVTHAINSTTVVSPSSLLAALVLSSPAPLPRALAVSRAAYLCEELLAAGAKLAPLSVPGADDAVQCDLSPHHVDAGKVAALVDMAAQLLCPLLASNTGTSPTQTLDVESGSDDAGACFVASGGVAYAAGDTVSQVVELSFYRNAIMHWLNPLCLVALAYRTATRRPPSPPLSESPSPRSSPSTSPPPYAVPLRASLASVGMAESTAPLLASCSAALLDSGTVSFSALAEHFGRLAFWLAPDTLYSQPPSAPLPAHCRTTSSTTGSCGCAVAVDAIVRYAHERRLLCIEPSGAPSPSPSPPPDASSCTTALPTVLCSDTLVHALDSPRLELLASLLLPDLDAIFVAALTLLHLRSVSSLPEPALLAAMSLVANYLSSPPLPHLLPSCSTVASSPVCHVLSYLHDNLPSPPVSREACAHDSLRSALMRLCDVSVVVMSCTEQPSRSASAADAGAAGVRVASLHTDYATEGTALPSLIASIAAYR